MKEITAKVYRTDNKIQTFSIKTLQKSLHCCSNYKDEDENYEEEWMVGWRDAVVSNHSQSVDACFPLHQKKSHLILYLSIIIMRFKLKEEGNNV